MISRAPTAPQGVSAFVLFGVNLTHPMTRMSELIAGAAQLSRPPVEAWYHLYRRAAAVGATTALLSEPADELSEAATTAGIAEWRLASRPWLRKPATTTCAGPCDGSPRLAGSGPRSAEAIAFSSACVNGPAVRSQFQRHARAPPSRSRAKTHSAAGHRTSRTSWSTDPLYPLDKTLESIKTVEDGDLNDLRGGPREGLPESGTSRALAVPGQTESRRCRDGLARGARRHGPQDAQSGWSGGPAGSLGRPRETPAVAQVGSRGTPGCSRFATSLRKTSLPSSNLASLGRARGSWSRSQARQPSGPSNIKGFDRRSASYGRRASPCTPKSSSSAETERSP